MASDANQAKRRMLLLLIFAPGVFFILYWAMTAGHNRQGAEKVEPPASFVEQGEWVSLNNDRYCLYTGEKTFLDRVKLGNNTAVPEPGRVFMGLGLAAGNGTGSMNVDVVDSLGNVYLPIDVSREVVAGNFGFDKANNHRLLLFKVNSEAESYFFRLRAGGDEAVWRINNSFLKQ